MSSARSNPRRWSLRTQLTLWTATVLSASLGAGFAWVHLGLRAVLESKNDALLARKGAELTGVARDETSGNLDALEAEINREVAAYEADGLVVFVHRPGSIRVFPPSPENRALAERLVSAGIQTVPRTFELGGGIPRYRALRTMAAPSDEPEFPLDLALSLTETEAILAQFDRRAAAGGAAFLALAILGGFWLARQALRPVALSIQTARKLNPADLTARLPRTGAGDELDQLAATINDLLDRLGAYHAQVIRFTADASHELRSPLGAMRASVEVALQRPRTVAEYRDTLASLGEQAERLTALVNGLLLLARADAGQIVLNRDQVNLTAIIDEVAEMYQPLAEERGIRLHWNRAEPLMVAGDAARLRQLVTNLLDNSIKFSEPGGVVTLRAERHAEQARLDVSDGGIGIAANDLPRIFDRFYQVDAARSAGGTGLGLSICRWIAEAHDGTIEATSQLGQGTTVSVVLPTTPPAIKQS